MLLHCALLLLVSIGASWVLPSEAAASVFKMYWTDDAGVLRRSDSAGGSVQDVLSSAPASPYALALDEIDGKLYYSELLTATSGSIKRVNLDGTGVETLMLRSAKPQDIALDPFGKKMYWAEGTETPGQFTINRANLDGSDAEDLAISGLSIVHGVALAAGKIYWTDEGTHKIQRANFDGTSVEDVITGLSIPDDIVIEPVVGKVYFTDSGGGTIRRASLDGTGLEDVLTGLNDPEGIALDVTGGKIYFLESNGAKIRRASFDGTGLEDLVASGLLIPRRIALQFDYGGSLGALDQCLAVGGPNVDADAEADATDRCPSTPSGEPVDEAGCSLAQFCSQFDATTRDGARACRKADWRNDEPAARAADCAVERGGSGSADDQCVPSLN